jgi:predicted  nucleic acid-binding Zn-ribbon protein
MPEPLFFVGCLNCSAEPLLLSPEEASARERQGEIDALRDRLDNAETELAELVKEKAEREGTEDGESNPNWWKNGPKVEEGEEGE